MPQNNIPPIGTDVTSLINTPQIGEDVTDLLYPKEEEKPSLFSRAWKGLTDPLTNIPSRFAEKVGEPLMKMGEEGKGFFGQTVPLYSGAFIKSLGNVGDMLSSPLNLAASATGVGAGITTAMAPKLSRALTTATRAQSVPVIAEGAYHATQGENLSQQLTGLLEAGLGIAGTRFKPRGPELVPPPKKFEVPTWLDTKAQTDIARPIASAFKDPSRLLPETSSPGNMPPRFFAGRRGIADAQNVPEIDTADFAKLDPRHKDATILPEEIGEITRPNPMYAAEEQLMGAPTSEIDIPISRFEPDAARSDSGGIKIGADIGSLSKVLGSSLYEGNIGKVATKELMQNSIDAVRDLGPSGEVNVRFNKDDLGQFVEVSDNGKGMTRQELETVFTDLGASGKRTDINAVGGFGLAKAAPLLGGERVKVRSVVLVPINKGVNRKVAYEFEGTPDELIQGVDIRESYVGSDIPTGTTVRTYIPKDVDIYDARELVKSVGQNSPGFQGKINVERPGFGDYKVKENYTPADRFKDADVIPLSNEYADVEIIIPKGTKYGPSSGVPYKILNQGMFQTKGRYGWDEINSIPEDISVNIKSKVDEGHTNYPFTANRESLRGDVLATVEKYLEDNIKKPSLARRRNELIRLYDEMPEINIGITGPRKFYLYNTGNRFTPDEVDLIIKNPVVRTLSKDTYDITNDLVSNMPPQWSDKLERIGLILDPGLHGIFIPSPATGKAAILINPFQVMSTHAPDQASASILHTIMHEIAHIEAGGHNADFASRLADVQTEAGARYAIRAQERIYRSIADPNTDEYLPEVSEVLQRYTEGSRRPDAIDDPLRGTGIKSKTGKSGTGRNAGDSNPSATAINKLREAIKLARPIRETQEELYSAERASRFSAASKVKTKGLKGLYTKLGKLKGELPKVEYTPIKLNQKDVDAIIQTIFENPNLMEGERIRAGVAFAKIVGKSREGGVPQRGELALLESTLGRKTVDDIRNLYASLGFFPTENIFVDAINIPKSLMSSTDVSAPFRQGLGMIHKKEFWTAIPDMFRAFGSQKAYDGIMESISDRMVEAGKRLGIENVSGDQVAKSVGLALTDMTEMLVREEAFISRLAGKLSNVKMANRAYVAFLNKVRSDVFNDLLKQAERAGHNVKTDQVLVKNLAKYINAATGRGSVGSWENAAANLNSVFFSPRLIASRVQLLNPTVYTRTDIPWFIKKQYLKSLFGIAAAGATVTTLAQLGQEAFGKEVEVDTEPTSADFGKSRIGNTRLDPYGGFQQYIVAASRLLAGEYTSTTSGRTNRLNTGRFGSSSRADVIENFARNKVNPVFAFVWDILEGHDQAGNPVQVPPAVANMFIPMIVNDVYQLMRDDPDLFPLSLLAASGIGLQTYGQPTVGHEIGQALGYESMDNFRPGRGIR